MTVLLINAPNAKMDNRVRSGIPYGRPFREGVPDIQWFAWSLLDRHIEVEDKVFHFNFTFGLYVRSNADPELVAVLFAVG